MTRNYSNKIQIQKIIIYNFSQTVISNWFGNQTIIRRKQKSDFPRSRLVSFNKYHAKNNQKIYLHFAMHVILRFSTKQRFVSSTGNMEILISHMHSIVCAYIYF